MCYCRLNPEVCDARATHGLAAALLTQPCLCDLAHAFAIHTGRTLRAPTCARHVRSRASHAPPPPPYPQVAAAWRSDGSVPPAVALLQRFMHPTVGQRLRGERVRRRRHLNLFRRRRPAAAKSSVDHAASHVDQSRGPVHVNQSRGHVGGPTCLVAKFVKPPRPPPPPAAAIVLPLRSHCCERHYSYQLKSVATPTTTTISTLLLTTIAAPASSSASSASWMSMSPALRS